MSHLHTLNDPELLPLCLRTVRAGDRLLLIEDGVYCAVNTSQLKLMNKLEVYALEDDLQARGLSGRVKVQVNPVSMGEFVGLCCEADRVVNWF